LTNRIALCEKENVSDLLALGPEFKGSPAMAGLFVLAPALVSSGVSA